MMVITKILLSWMLKHRFYLLMRSHCNYARSAKFDMNGFFCVECKADWGCGRGVSVGVNTNHKEMELVLCVYYHR